jgi:hypothetical protein
MTRLWRLLLYSQHVKYSILLCHHDVLPTNQICQLFVNSNDQGWRAHTHGISELLRHRSQSNFTSQVWESLSSRLRIICVCAMILSLKVCFISRHCIGSTGTVRPPSTCSWGGQVAAAYICRQHRRILPGNDGHSVRCASSAGRNRCRSYQS